VAGRIMVASSAESESMGVHLLDTPILHCPVQVPEPCGADSEPSTLAGPKSIILKSVTG
jgi:hypothetical protein